MLFEPGGRILPQTGPAAGCIEIDYDGAAIREAYEVPGQIGYVHVDTSQSLTRLLVNSPVRPESESGIDR